MLKALILDSSGTYMDDRIPVWKTNNAMLRFYGQQPLSFEGWLEYAHVKSIKELYGLLNVGSSESKLQELFSFYYNNIVANETAPKIYPDVVPVLSTLSSDTAIYTVSKHPLENLIHEAQLHDIYQYFTMFISTDDKVLGIRTILHKLGINPSEACYIGDIITDMIDAKEAGVAAIAVGDAVPGHHSDQRGYGKPNYLKKEADFYLSNLYGLPELISKINDKQYYLHPNNFLSSV